MAATKSSGTYRRHVSDDGRVSFTATVRVAGFKSASKTFPSRKEARAWATATRDLQTCPTMAPAPHSWALKNWPPMVHPGDPLSDLREGL
jgi:hypothetical protein